MAVPAPENAIAKPSDEFRWYEGLAICLGMIGIQISSEVIAGWGNYFYTPSEGTGRVVFITATMASAMFVFGRLFDMVSDPLVGLWSDKTRVEPTKRRFPPLRGRRRPFLFWGALLMTATGILFWYPPVEGTSWANWAYGTLIVTLHWGFFTTCYVPITALGPEIAQSQKARSQLGIWFGVGMVLGLTIASVAPGIMIDSFAGEIEGPPPAAAYQKMAAIFAFVSLVLFQAPIWLIRERYEMPPEEVHRFRPWQQTKDALRNPAFLAFFAGFFFLYIGYLGLQRALPYWAELGLGGDEGFVTFLMLPFIFTALLSLPFIMLLYKFVPLKFQLMLAFVILTVAMPLTYLIAVWQPEPFEPGSLMKQWMGLLGTDSPVAGLKAACGAGVFAVCGIGQGLIYALHVPALGEIIDYDEVFLSGERREALYNGFAGVAFKGSTALSIVMANQVMALWGKSAEDPTGIFLVGPVAGIMGLLAIAAISNYPRVSVSKRAPDEL